MGAERTPRRRRVYVAGRQELGALSDPISAWTKSLGHIVAEDAEREMADLEVVSAEAGAGRGRWVAVSSRRLAPEHQLALREAGAAHVFDGRQGLIDLAFCYAELLFEKRADQRRHSLAYGELEVGVKTSDTTGDAYRTRLVGLNRCGAWVQVPSGALAHDSVVDLHVSLGGIDGELRGRVVEARALALGDTRLIAVELALEHQPGLPNFRSLARAHVAHPNRDRSPA